MRTGIYDQIISNRLKKQLDELDEKKFYSEELDNAESAQILSDYVKKIIEQKLGDYDDDDIVGRINFANKIIESVIEEESNTDQDVAKEGKMLKAILTDEALINIANMTAKDLAHPETSISYSSLFTGATREPHMFEELKREIMTADRIDLLVSFIRWSGLRLLIGELKQFTDNGGQLRVITTSYMGATEIKAIQELSKLSNTEIKISYDIEHTRLHAKTYVFYRETDFSTAYVGSSNMTKPAMTSGLEWNIKVAKKELPSVFEKIEATFEAYWNSDEFQKYTEKDYDILREALKKNDGIKERKEKINYYFDVSPYPYQQAILDKLKADREVKNSYKNLVVAATGCGKTIIAAFDYKAQCRNNYRPKLLFVAHRKEILEQSLECFREVLHDSEFGDLFVGSYTPEQYNHLFVSIDMINSRKLYDYLSEDFYEFIVMDECHHMAANSYQKIVEYFKPKILLGLTATPERMDGDSILPYFDNRIAAEIRLPEAINRKLLCPFQYFGIEDTVNLDEVRWTRGGYEISDLNNLYVFTQEVAKRRAKQIIGSLDRYVADIEEVKGLAFCVSVEHAKFMDKMFNEAGISSMCITGQTPENEREAVKSKLKEGNIKIVCVVDIFNEGVDLKEINTVLFLRPTDSLTIFLQQLGRGLRLADDKECLTVLDFVGHANKKYNFESKFQALLEKSNRGLKKEIESGFINLPKGCYIKLEKIVKEVILDNIKNSTSTLSGIRSRAKTFEEDTGMELTMYNFLSYYNMTARMFYKNKITFAQLQDYINDEGKSIYDERAPYKILNRISLTDSRDFLKYMICKIENYKNVKLSDLSEEEKDYWKMLYMSLYDKKPDELNSYLERICDYLDKNKPMIKEIIDVMKFNLEQIDFIDLDPLLPYKTNLRVYSTYTRAQALAALDYWNTSSEGVTRIVDKKTTCLFITLNKSNNYYSPSTSYHDYSISENLFHWQSQNSTSESTSVGQRYIHHKEQGETILLFVREAKEDKYGPMPFMFLGEADYLSHTGNKPMSVIWKLKNKIPAKFISVTDKLGVG